MKSDDRSSSWDNPNRHLACRQRWRGTRDQIHVDQAMCDQGGGTNEDPDEFAVPWHGELMVMSTDAGI
jgi:hypothetical protein